MEQKLHTPEGVRDIYNSECKKKLKVEEKLHQILQLYGYQDIQTPTFEYFDVFRKEIGTIPSRELYKFFDREGNTLVLRPDLTPSIARAAATLFEDEDFPIRLCYKANTFINHRGYLGKLKENTQMGAELIGIDSIEADAEMIAMVADSLKKVGLKEFQINIGHVDFMKSLLDATGLSDELKSEIHTLVANRNFFGVDEILDESQADDRIKQAFSVLSELTGDAEVLRKAAAVAPDERAEQAIIHLIKMYQILTVYGVEDHVTFDMSMSGSYGYYTGIIFRAYTYGTGDAIVRGGRYDHLLEKFGKNTPSIGFAVIIDELLNALNRQKIEISTGHTSMIVYTEQTLKKAITMANEFRAKGRSIEMLKRKDTDTQETFLEYGKRTQAANMLYLNEDTTVTMINLKTGEEKTVGKPRK